MALWTLAGDEFVLTRISDPWEADKPVSVAATRKENHHRLPDHLMRSLCARQSLAVEGEACLVASIDCDSRPLVSQAPPFSARDLDAAVGRDFQVDGTGAELVGCFGLRNLN